MQGRNQGCGILSWPSSWLPSDRVGQQRSLPGFLPHGFYRYFVRLGLPRSHLSTDWGGNLSTFLKSLNSKFHFRSFIFLTKWTFSFILWVLGNQYTGLEILSFRICWCYSGILKPSTFAGLLSGNICVYERDGLGEFYPCHVMDKENKTTENSQGTNSG